LVAAERGEGESCERDSSRTARIGDRIGLFQQRRCSFELALKASERRKIVKGDRQHAERPFVAGQLNAPGGEDVPCLVVKEVGRYATGEARPADIQVGLSALIAKRS